MAKASIIKINTPSFMTNLKEGSSLELKVVPVSSKEFTSKHQCAEH
jgi:hypothetical protein